MVNEAVGSHFYWRCQGISRTSQFPSGSLLDVNGDRRRIAIVIARIYLT